MSTEKEKTVEIRRATGLDCVKIYHLMSNHMKHDAPELPQPEPNIALRNITRLIAEGVLIVADCGGKIVGAIGGHLDHTWWAGSPFFRGVLYCIHPEYSKHGAGSAIINKLRTLATIPYHGHNVPLDIHFSPLGSDVGDEKARLVRDAGFVDTGGTFIFKAGKLGSETESKEVAQ